MSKSGRDDLMRQDGYVTAAEIAEATGQNVVSVMRAIEDGRIPGERVAVSEKYARWYVDIHGLIKSGLYKPEGAGKTIHDRLVQLGMLVKKPASKPTARSGTMPKVKAPSVKPPAKKPATRS